MTQRYRAHAIALLAGAAMIAMGGAAHATAFTVSASATTKTPPNVTQTDAKSFAQFDPATGTLTGVKFTLTSTSDVNSIASITGGEAGTAKSSMSATFQVLGPGAGGPLAV